MSPGYGIRIPKIPVPKISIPKAPAIKIPKFDLSTPILIGSNGRVKCSKELKSALWKKYFGKKKTGLCYCCKKETIKQSFFVCGHVKAAASGGTVNFPNLRPICHECNSRMRTHNLESWCKKQKALKKGRK